LHPLILLQTMAALRALPRDAPERVISRAPVMVSSSSRSLEGGRAEELLCKDRAKLTCDNSAR
jgi:hypothetical protein